MHNMRMEKLLYRISSVPRLLPEETYVGVLLGMVQFEPNTIIAAFGIIGVRGKHSA